MEDAMKDKIGQMESEALAAELKGQQAMMEGEGEEVDEKFGSDSDSDFDDKDGESEKIMRAMREQRL